MIKVSASVCIDAPVQVVWDRLARLVEGKPSRLPKAPVTS